MPQSTSSALEASTLLARYHYENFPVGSILLPKEKRHPLHMLYAFARMADDFADEPQFEGKRLEALASFRGQLNQPSSRDPFFSSLHTVIKQNDLPIVLFHDLLDAFEQDVTKNRYQTLKEITLYASKSANPIGRLYLRLYGFTQWDAYADAICTALQWINFWQDVSVDLEKNRIYIPLESMEKFGVCEEDLKNHIENQNFISMMKELVETTRIKLSEGLPLLSLVRGRLRIELSMIVQGGRAILDKIEKQNYCVLSKRPTLKKMDRILHFCKAWYVRT